MDGYESPAPAFSQTSLLSPRGQASTGQQPKPFSAHSLFSPRKGNLPPSGQDFCTGVLSQSPQVLGHRLHGGVRMPQSRGQLHSQGRGFVRHMAGREGELVSRRSVYFNENKVHLFHYGSVFGHQPATRGREDYLGRGDIL